MNREVLKKLKHIHIVKAGMSCLGGIQKHGPRMQGWKWESQSSAGLGSSLRQQGLLQICWQQNENQGKCEATAQWGKGPKQNADKILHAFLPQFLLVRFVPRPPRSVTLVAETGRVILYLQERWTELRTTKANRAYTRLWNHLGCIQGCRGLAEAVARPFSVVFAR